MKMKRVLALVLSSVLVTACFTGCGVKAGNGDKNKINPNATQIEIAYWNSGLGTDWLQKVVDGFNAKYPDYYVTYTAQASLAATTATFGMDDIDKVDIYMGEKIYDTTYMEPLDDVLSATVEGEGMTIAEKLSASYLDMEKFKDGHYYTLTYGGGLYSMVYNRKIFEDAGIKELPRTTDEWMSVSAQLSQAGYTPNCTFSGEGYLECLMHVFMVQQDGYDYFLNNFYGCTDKDGTSPSKEVFTTKDGRYYGLKALQKVFTPQYTLIGSNTKSHTEIQTEFLNESAAMMYNGSWLQNEMSNVGSMEDFSVMRTPVISTITNRLSTVKKEKDLRTVISAVDKVADGEKQLSDYAQNDAYVVDGVTVSAQDWEEIYNARNTTYANYTGCATYIPKYSAEKEGAKEFLKYMFSDEGYALYLEALGIPKPMSFSDGREVNMEGYSEFQKMQFHLLDSATYVIDSHMSNKHNIFLAGGAHYLANVTYIDKFSTNNSNERKSADEVWDMIVKKIDSNYEANWLSNME